MTISQYSTYVCVTQFIFSFGSFSVSICSVIGASPSILAPVFVLLGSFVDVVAAIFGGSCVCITQFICWCCCSYIRFKRLLGMEVPLKFAPLPRMQLQLTVLLSVGMVSFSYFILCILLVEKLLWSWIYYSYVYVLELLIASVIVSPGKS